jgi:hypothetical protein
VLCVIFLKFAITVKSDKVEVSGFVEAGYHVEIGYHVEVLQIGKTINAHLCQQPPDPVNQVPDKPLGRLQFPKLRKNMRHSLVYMHFHIHRSPL